MNNNKDHVVQNIKQNKTWNDNNEKKEKNRDKHKNYTVSSIV